MHTLRARWLTGTICLLIAAAGTGHAQSRALIVVGYAGGFFPLTNLADAGDDFGTAFSAGGGAGLQLSPNVALRGTVTYVRTDYRGGALSLSDPDFTRLFYAADLQIGWPSESGLAPYLLGGAGVVSVDPRDSGIESFTKLAVRFGSGINYVSGTSVVFVEASGWAYRSDELGFARTQVELLIHAGFAFALPF